MAFRLLFIFLRFNVALQSCSTILLQLIRYTWLQINARLSHVGCTLTSVVGISNVALA